MRTEGREPRVESRGTDRLYRWQQHISARGSRDYSQTGRAGVQRGSSRRETQLSGQGRCAVRIRAKKKRTRQRQRLWRSEEHTSELQSRPHLVCRLLLEKKKKYK